MKEKLNLYSQAEQAFNVWSLKSPRERAEVLDGLKREVPAELMSAFTYQYRHTAAISSKTHSLVSPTGETNELYTQGRGVSLLLADSGADNAPKAVIAMLVAMLLSGNSVVVCSDNEQVTWLITMLIQSPVLPLGVLQLAQKDSYAALIGQDIRNVALIGDSQAAVALNKQLSARPNAITALVAETDLAGLPNAKDPMLALRFVTERVRTINITAIGGNAMLLELGSDK